MNCIQFEQQVHDLVPEKASEVALDEALAHAEQCAGCAHLLADSRALRSGLRSLAEDGARQVPPRLEAILLAAFRRERRADVIRVRRARWAWVSMAAAAVLILAATAREWRQRSRAGVPHGAAQVEARKAHRPAAGTPASSAEARPRVSQPWPRRPGPARTSRKAAPKHGAIPQPRKPQTPRPSAGEIEWATDFLPLPGADGAASSDAGELVRVELPRSALAELGLPPTGEAEASTITAEVFIGEDGVARSIRFAR